LNIKITTIVGKKYIIVKKCLGNKSGVAFAEVCVLVVDYYVEIIGIHHGVES
jgi:hypothetical protein